MSVDPLAVFTGRGAAPVIRSGGVGALGSLTVEYEWLDPLAFYSPPSRPSMKHEVREHLTSASPGPFVPPPENTLLMSLQHVIDPLRSLPGLGSLSAGGSVICERCSGAKPGYWVNYHSGCSHCEDGCTGHHDYVYTLDARCRGACTLPDGSCVEIPSQGRLPHNEPQTRAICEAMGGDYGGTGVSACPTGPVIGGDTGGDDDTDTTLGACCIAGACTGNVTHAACDAAGGAFHTGVACDASPCGVVGPGGDHTHGVGACCTAAGACTEMTSADCASWQVADPNTGYVYKGDGSACAPGNRCLEIGGAYEPWTDHQPPYGGGSYSYPQNRPGGQQTLPAQSTEPQAEKGGGGIGGLLGALSLLGLLFAAAAYKEKKKKKRRSTVG